MASVLPAVRASRRPDIDTPQPLSDAGSRGVLSHQDPAVETAAMRGLRGPHTRSGGTSRCLYVTFERCMTGVSTRSTRQLASRLSLAGLSIPDYGIQVSQTGQAARRFGEECDLGQATVSPVDPVGMGASALFVVGVAVAAALLAARPATRYDPLIALRYE